MKYSLKRACLHRLRDTFGLKDYRPGQKEAVHTLLSGRDVICIFPTGAGKSLCWQLPAVVHGGVTVVISPLIALMRDQVQHLAAQGIPAVSLDSLMSREERETAMAQVRSGSARILFVSPERLNQASFRRLCIDVQPWLVVVDEAHCVVQWGETFRPAYQHISDFAAMLPKQPVLCAMTATADDGMKRAIRQTLGMRRPKEVILPIIRENLVYGVRTTLNRTGEILRLAEASPCKTLIFCSTRNRTERLSARLKENGHAAECYHAGLERDIRMAVQDRFMAGETQILCATSAFGLGVDIPDIRRVIHDDLPSELIDYVQQSGRAGRDGEKAECILFFEPNDLIRKAAIRNHAISTMGRRPISRYMFLLKFWRRIQRVMRVLFAAKCIPAGIAAEFGRRHRACGQCSACRMGRQMRRVPLFVHDPKWRIRYWLLSWQRDALAKKKRCFPGQIMSSSAMGTAAKLLVFPEEAPRLPEMERLLMHLRSEKMHDSEESRIS